MLNDLKQKNNKLINKNKNNENKLKKLLIIQQLLKNDNLFFEIPIEIAFSILKLLEIDDYLNYYIKLISYDKYFK